MLEEGFAGSWLGEPAGRTVRGLLGALVADCKQRRLSS